MMKEMIMTIKEIIGQLEYAQQFHNADELVCIYDQETGERYDIEYVDDMITNEVQLNIKGLTND